MIDEHRSPITGGASLAAHIDAERGQRECRQRGAVAAGPAAAANALAENADRAIAVCLDRLVAADLDGIARPATRAVSASRHIQARLCRARAWRHGAAQRVVEGRAAVAATAADTL